MLRAIEQLVSGERTKVGNHYVKSYHYWEDFFYHSTCICSVDHGNKSFKTDNGGWNTSSTTRAINDYRKYFLSRGYKDLNESEDKSC